MSRRRRAIVSAGAVVCLAAAAALFLLAVDARRWQTSIRADDVRYLASPADEGLWHPATVLPGDPAGRLLGVADDVRFREALRALRLGRLEQGFSSDPALALPRAEAQARLSTLAKQDASNGRRSRALGLLGVIAYAGSEVGIGDRERLLREAVAALDAAIAADPSNDEAKANLELALQQQEALRALPSGGIANPSRGGAGQRGAGSGKSGSGY